MSVESFVPPQVGFGRCVQRFQQRSHSRPHLIPEGDSRLLLCVVQGRDRVVEVERELVCHDGARQHLPLLIRFEAQLPQRVTQEAVRGWHAARLTPAAAAQAR